MESTSNIWFDETKKRVAGQRANVKLLQNAEPLENDKLTKMDSSLKKLTAFMKKTKSIGASNPAAQLLPELDKLNLLKFLDEIASNICDLKLKASEIPDLINFVIQLSCRYQQFPELLLNELKKILPYKKSDKIENPGKLKFDLKFLGELVLNGIFAKPGVDLLGNCLAFLVQTDTSEFTHVSLLLPLCRPTLFDFVGFIPFSEKLKKFDHDELEELTTTAFTENNRRAVRTLLKNYYDSLIKQLNNIRIKMNKMHKSIKKQERTKGDASQFDRQEFESLKQGFEKLKQMAQDFGEVLGEQVPQMDEDPSDDEIDEGLARQIDNDLAEGKTSLWPDKDTMNFYECLMDTTRLSPMKLEVNIEDADDDKIEPETTEEKTVAEFAFADSVDAVDLTELENSPDTTTVVEDYIEEEEPEETQDESNVTTEPSSLDQILDSMHQPQFLGVQITTFLENLSSAMNRDLIDRAASYFVAALSKKSNRKKLINHFLNSPRDRLDLLPFYGRFLATTNRVIPDIASTVTKELLLRFRVLASSKIEPPKKIKEAQRKTRKVDEGVFLSRFLAELTKFKLLPKAETLTCLRSLLVDLRSYKVDMAAVMIESVGIFLYRSSDSHAKMKVILEVVQRKMGVIKDPRHKILLENAYYSVLPPEETCVLHMRDPLKSYISTVVRSIAPTKRGKDPVKILLGIDWTDSSLVDYLCSQLSDVCAINYDYLADVADTVRGLSDSFSDLGVFVTDTVLESIRIALETNKMVHHQRLHCSVNYLNWLYVCGVCEFSVIMQVLYQLIRLGINLESYSLDQLIKRTKRIRVAADLVIEVIEYVDTGKSSIQLDNFIHYLLNFYYSTQSLWKDRSEDLGDFPFDVVDRIEKMLAHIAKICGKKRITRYAKDLDASKENIAKIEEKYKFDVQRSLAQGLKMATTEATLDSIQEEEEDASDDDEEVEDEEDDEIEDEHEVDTSEHDEPAKAHYVDTTDPEEIHVHVKRKFDENDAEFDRDFERMLAESIQMAAHQPRQPIIDLTVPPSVRQKFERKINFVGEKINDEPKNFQMALMTKSKGKPMLKPVQLHVSQSMKDSWNQQRMHSEKERQQVKEITLQMNERIQQRVDEEPLDPIPQTVPNRFQTDPSDCHIPAGPRQKH